MARTQDEIEQSLIESVHSNDPSTDTRKGPVYNFLLRPVPPELQKTEADAERIAILTTQQLDQVATEAEIQALATSFSIRLGGGKASKTKGQQFFAYAKPEQDIVINRGTLVGTDDQQYTYFVSEPVTIPANTADNYYNPQTRRYEITTSAEATSVGPDFDLPRTRVKKLLTPIDGIDGTINILDYDGGEEAEDLAGSVDRIRSKLAGLDPETGGGIISDIRNYDPETITDVSLVFPKDRGLFKRLTNRPAIDAYVKGEILETISETLVASGGETQLVLSKQPVRSVTSILVNGTGVSFSFIEDTSFDVGFSPRAASYVLLDSPLLAADVAVVTYQYNILIAEIQEDLFSLERPFDTDVLAREPRAFGVAISIDATVVASFDTARVYTNIEAKLFAEVEQDFFIDVLQPDVIAQKIKDEVAGLAAKPRFTIFRRTSGGLLEVDTIAIEKNEDPYIDQDQLSINVRR